MRITHVTCVSTGLTVVTVERSAVLVDRSLKDGTLLAGLVNWFNRDTVSRLAVLVLLLGARKYKSNNHECLQRTMTKSDKVCPVSLRTLHALVQHRVPEGTDATTIVNIHEEYKTQIKQLTRTRFHPFCRGANKLHMHIEGPRSGCLETCIAQLNFVKWLLNQEIVTSSGQVATWLPDYKPRSRRKGASNPT